MEIKKPIKACNLIKVTDAASELKCSRFKIYEMIESDKIDHIKVNDTPIVVINEKYKNLKHGTN